MTERGIRMRFGAMLVGALLLGGCGNLTSGGLGDVEVIVAVDSVPSGDFVSGQLADEGVFPSHSSSFARAPQVPPEPIRGTLTVRVQVYVRRGSARWIEVTDGVQEVEMPLVGGDPVALAEKNVPTGPYTAVRTVFRRVEADVQSGLEVDGVAVTGPIPVDLGAEDHLVVDRPIELEVSEGARSSLAMDLHATRWLRLLDRDRKQVRQEDFEGEVALRRRP
jgi:hypothetical protein